MNFPVYRPTMAWDRLFGLILTTAMAASVLIPRVFIQGRSVGLDDILGLAGFAIGSLWLVLNWRRFAGWRLRLVVVLLIVLVAHGIASSVIASWEFLGVYALPSEFWQYLKRAGYLLVGAAFVCSGAVGARRLVFVITIVFLLTLMIGVAQAVIPDIMSGLTQAYARTATQLQHATREIGFRRVIGVAGLATSWSGFAAYGLALGIALWYFANERGIRVSHWPLGGMRWLGLAMASLAVVNIALAGSRIGLLCMAIIILCSMIGLVVTRSSSWARQAFLVTMLVTPVAVALLLFEERALFFLYRLSVLVDTQGGDRMDQVAAGLSVLRQWDVILLGVGNAAQRSLVVSHGIEVEFVYLLVNYGVVGLLLRIALMGVLLSAAVVVARRTEGFERILGFSSALIIVASLALMTAYFFFQEIVVGTTVWILFGATLGVDEVESRRVDQERSLLSPGELFHA